jgi:hypothetical protein
MTAEPKSKDGPSDFEKLVYSETRYFFESINEDSGTKVFVLSKNNPRNFSLLIKVVCFSWLLSTTFLSNLLLYAVDLMSEIEHCRLNRWEKSVILAIIS